jgi:peptide/nickel transport system substrate-binding protein
MHFRIATVVLALIAVVPLSAARAQAPLVIATSQEPDNIDVSQTRNPPIVAPTLLNIVEPLFDLKSNGDVVPGMAAYQISDDGRMVEFKLRPGVKFHNGDPVTAADIEFSNKRLLEKDVNYARDMRSFDRTEVVDAQTIRFYFKQPSVIFFKNRGLKIMSKTYFDRVGEAAFARSPIGTGPYKFVAYEPGQYLDLAANEDYWGGAPPVKKVRFVFIKEDSTRVAKLKAGEVDIIMNTPFGEVAQLQKAGFKTESTGVNPSVSLFFAPQNKALPWSDVRVRRAIAEAIDADAIVKGLLYGVPKRYAALSPGEVGYDPDLPLFKYDPAAAKKLLAEAGHPNGFNMRLYYLSSSYTGVKETAEAVALYLKAVGINADVQGYDAPKMMEMIRQQHNNPEQNWVGVWPMFTAHTPEPTVGIGLAFYSKSPFALYNNPTLDEIYEKAAATLDDGKRGELIKQAYRLLTDDVEVAQIWSNISTHAMKPNIDYKPATRTYPNMQLREVTVH